MLSKSSKVRRRWSRARNGRVLCILGVEYGNGDCRDARRCAFAGAGSPTICDQDGSQNDECRWCETWWLFRWASSMRRDAAGGARGLEGEVGRWARPVVPARELPDAIPNAACNHETWEERLLHWATAPQRPPQARFRPVHGQFPGRNRIIRPKEEVAWILVRYAVCL